MKSFIKYFLLILLIAGNLIVGKGCKKVTNQEKLQLEGLRYMRNKYGDEIVFSVKTSTIDAERYNMYLTVEGKDDWDVRLTWYDKTKSFKDNYMSWVFRDKVEEIYFPLIKSVYRDCVAFNLPYGGQKSDLYRLDTVVEEYLETVLPSSFVVFTTSEISEKEGDMHKLSQILNEKQLNISIGIYYVAQEQLMELTRENMQDIMNNENYILKGGFKKYKGENPDYETWMEGKRYE